MKLFLMSLVIFVLAVLGMAIGILTGRQPINGGCGGRHGIRKLGSSCTACDEPCPNRDNSDLHDV